MNERDTALLDNYFNELLSPEEARGVEARAAADAGFRQEFDLRKEMEAFPRKESEREALTGLLKTIGKDYFKAQIEEQPQMKVQRNNLRRWMALAASVLLVAAAVWFFRQSEAPTYREYARHAPLSLTVMGDTQPARTEAESAFNQKDYARALAALDQLLAAEPDNPKASFYRGICLLELDRGAEARAVFEPLAAGNSALKEDATWYIALSYLKEQDKAACKSALMKIDTSSAHHAEAREILKGLY